MTNQISKGGVSYFIAALLVFTLGQIVISLMPSSPMTEVILNLVSMTIVVALLFFAHRTSSGNKVFFGGALAVFVLFQVLFSFNILNPFWNQIIRTGAAVAIVALGLNLIYGFNGQFSLGQWAFYAIGAYSAADVTYRWTIDKSAVGLVVLLLGVAFTAAAILVLRKLLSRVRGLDTLSAFTLYIILVVIVCYLALVIGNAIAPAVTGLLHLMPDVVSLQIVYVISVLLAGLLAAEISFLFGLPVLTLGSDYFGIATLGLTIIVKVLLDNSDTILPFVEMKGARGMVGIPKITTWAWIFFFLLLIVVLTRNLLHSSYGRAIISVREDEIAAKAMGIDVAHYKTLTFVIGSLFAGLAGGLYAHIIGFLHPNTFNFIKSFDPMIIIVMGGLGSVTGTLAAAFTLYLVLEGGLRLWLPDGFETWRYVIYPVLLLLTMLLRSKGLFGDYEIPFLRMDIPRLSEKLRGKKAENLHPAGNAAPQEVAK
jgi:branched-chain amino acid transport system permease protein